MRKIKRKLAELFLNKTLYKCDEGGFDVKATKYFIKIKSKASNFELRIDNSTYAYGYLIYALEYELFSQVGGFASLVYNTAMVACSDQGLVDDIRKAFVKYTKRMDKKAEAIAKGISEDDDNLAMEEMKFNQEYAKKSKKERKVYQDALREELRKENKDE